MAAVFSPRPATDRIDRLNEQQRAAVEHGADGDAGEWPAELEAVQAWYLPLLQRLHEDAPARANASSPS